MARSPFSVRRTLGSLLVAVLSVLGIGLAGIGLAAPAHAEDGFRYWNYFHLNGDTWEFSSQGVGEYQPEDGTVEGLRFGTTPASDTDGLPPRADLAEVNFDTICADQQAGTGEKRVAFVIDFGTEADAEGGTIPEPRAACAVVPQDATALQALESVGEVRAENGLLCAVDGHPATGCGDPVADAQPAGEEQPVSFDLPTAAQEETENAAAGTQDDGFPWAVVLIGVVAAVVALGAVVLARRDRNA